MSKSFGELSQIGTFEERFRYLSIGARIGDTTFGGERFLNQAFYNSTEWKRARHQVLIRDGSCDLGMPDRVIFARPVIHHIEPITPEDFRYRHRALLDLDNLITVSHRTHNAIHFSDESQLDLDPVERQPDDHISWKRSR